MERRRFGLEWTVGHSGSPDEEPSVRVPAGVPGAVQLDWAAAQGWPPHYEGTNYKDYEWMEDRFWSYRTVPDVPDVAGDQRLIFVCRGVDYRFEVRLDGGMLHEQEGMFTPFELDLTDKLVPGARLEIVVFPAPKKPGAERGRAEASQSCKPAVGYGWDWHPRLIPLGIWDEAYLEVRPASHIRQAETTCRLLGLQEGGPPQADVSLRVVLSQPGGLLRWRVYDPSGKLAAERTLRPETGDADLELVLDDPELWWPNGHGEAALYTSEAMLLSENGQTLDRAVSRFGARSVRLVMHEGAWDEPSRFPKSRSDPPITLEINGRRLFAKGTNWVPPDIFPGTLDRARYEELLELARDAHMNLVRVWGGGIANKDSFFDLCDEKGLLVWQEFPLACNDYEGTPGYLKVLDRESRSIILRLRSRACLAMWCGGNELFNGWSGMNDQSPALRLLNRNCFELDPETPFLPTSPVTGMGHGHYVFRDEMTGEEVFQLMASASCTAYTEFGIPSPAGVEQLKAFIPPEQLYPPRRGGTWEAHHAFGAWEEDTWLCEGLIEDYFGPHRTLEELVERGQLLQTEGYKCIYEEARRQKPKCSMALNWCFNEAWPAAANNSLVCWPAVPKPALAAVKQACRPVLASARIPRFSWREGEWFEPQLWMLNDSPESVREGRLTAYLEIGERRYALLAWTYPEMEANGNAPGPTIRYRLPAADAGGRMRLVLETEGHPERGSAYTLLLKPGEDGPCRRKGLNL